MSENGSGATLDVDRAVYERYAKGAQAQEAALCCPVEYDARYLEVIPEEILERDYGCGDPSQHLEPGDVVLDLGSGTGKICYIASQVVGSEGRVIGVDVNDEMLDVARRHRTTVADRVGFDNVEFRRGRIQDLATNLDRIDAFLAEHPIRSVADLQAFENFRAEEARERPLVASDSVDAVVSNCVLNLVHDADKRTMFDEIFRVLRRGGRAVISDIVADEEVPEAMRNDPELWSGCISGAFQESEFLEAFAEAGFHGIEILKRDEKPWQTVEGIEFRSVTVRAYKGKQGDCWEHGQAVIYKGPWSEVRDDDGHVLVRGLPMAVCQKTFEIYTKGPYAEHVIGLSPRVAIAPEDAAPFDCSGDRARNPRELKGMATATTAASDDSSCGPTNCC